MTLSWFQGGSRKRDQVVAVDLGRRCTKAVLIENRGDGASLKRYAILEAPVAEKEPSAALLTEHLRAVTQSLETRAPLLSLAIGVDETIVRYAELPQMPIPDMRQVLKTSSKLYLQQDLPGYVFDCWPVNGRAESSGSEKAKAPNLPKQKVLVAGAKKTWVDTLHAAIKGAGCMAGDVVPGLVAPINALEKAEPELFQREVVALVDLGFRHSSVCILQEGELVLTRVLAMGGDQITQGLADTMGISYAEAEGIKLGMPGEVREQLFALIAPLGRELKASLDFYEHQNDRPVTHVLVSGAGAAAEWVLQALQAELVAECRTWDPTAGLQRALPPQQLAELEQVAPQLSVAVGTALATL
jgi:type IV pilus assembly protein PilM